MTALSPMARNASQLSAIRAKVDVQERLLDDHRLSIETLLELVESTAQSMQQI